MADAPRSGRPLDPETLAAYVDGRLPPDERTRIEAELASDPELYEWLVQTMHAEEHVDIKVPRVPEVPEVPEGLVPEVPIVPATPKLADERASEGGPRGVVVPFHRRRGFVATTASVLAVAAALLLVVRLQPAWWQQMWGPAIDPRVAKLVAAVGEERYIEGRLTGGFRYGPLRSVTRGSNDSAKQNLALLAAARELQNAAQTDPTATNLQAAGAARLLIADYEGAIASLNDALTASQRSPAVLSDLSAVYAARGAVSGAVADWQQSLALSNLAIQQSLTPPIEALFNRALAAERLGDPATRTYWQSYLEIETQPDWQAEARNHLSRVPQDRR